MSNDEYRAEQAERRQHGLKARHEQRLENATYTAAEVKVLTEKAGEFGRLLGRKEAAERIAQLHKPLRSNVPGSRCPECQTTWPCETTKDCWRLAYPNATSGRTDPEEPK